jgi:hypothetical protein
MQLRLILPNSCALSSLQYQLLLPRQQEAFSCWSRNELHVLRQQLVLCLSTAPWSQHS